MEQLLPFWPVILSLLGAAGWLARLEFSVAHIQKERAKDEIRREKQREEDEKRWGKDVESLEARFDRARAEDRLFFSQRMAEVKGLLDEQTKALATAIEARHVDMRERMQSMERNLVDRISIANRLTSVEQTLERANK